MTAPAGAAESPSPAAAPGASFFNAATEIRTVAPLSMSPSSTPGTGSAASGGQGGGTVPPGAAEPTGGGTLPAPAPASAPGAVGVGAGAEPWAGSEPASPDEAFWVYQAGGA
ncbi:hypothetical protein [Streptomyces sp. AC495_CC817]|uniref:hypothetical protein n=1 Tax=Streptomyces sp. AC495_CC817 TaxID=2823900 RepID=UPI001C26EFE9|nr:hypothetical protein [Streptomyces sp. AC495_CC817]